MEPISLAIGIGSLAVRAAPTIARWLGGSDAEEVTAQVAEVAREVLGSSDPEEASKATPAAWNEFQVRVAAIAAAREEAWLKSVLEEQRAAFADTANARAMAVASDTLATVGARFGAVVMFCFVATLGATFFIEVPHSNREVLNIAMGMLLNCVSLIIGFYYGSSAGSARKDMRSRAQGD